MLTYIISIPIRLGILIAVLLAAPVVVMCGNLSTLLPARRT